MKINLFLLFLKSLVILNFAHAATYVVNNGESIQSSVSGTASGDVVIVRGGTYSDQNITITQPIRLAREKTTTVTIGGQIKLSGVSGNIVLRDFAIDVNGNGKLIIENCTNVGIEDLTDLPQGIEISNSTVIIRSCQFGDLNVSSGSTVQLIDSNLSAITSNSSDITVADTDFTTGSFTGGSALIQESNASGEVTFNTCNWRSHETTFQSNLKSIASDSKLIKSTVDLAFEHNGTQNDCTVFQSTVGREVGSPLQTDANRSWISYSTLHNLKFIGGLLGHVKKNKILTDLSVSSGVQCNAPNLDLLFFNNELFKGSTSTTSFLYATSSKRGNAWTTSKSFNVGNILVQNVKNRLKGSYSTNVRGYCRVKFTYTDGQSSYSNTGSAALSYENETYNNPNPTKFVSEISLELRHDYSDQYAYEYDTSITLSDGTSVNTIPSIWIHQIKGANIFNNFFRHWSNSEANVLISSTPSQSVNIDANIFWLSSGSWSTHAINAPAQSGSSATHNYFQNASYAVTGGLSNFDNITGGDPGFVDSTNGDFRLSSSSQLKDAGPEEPEFNDHDGTRNDIGMYGGHFYDQNGTQSIKPVVLGSNQSTYRIDVGETTPITIQARAAVATPKQ